MKGCVHSVNQLFQGEGSDCTIRIYYHAIKLAIFVSHKSELTGLVHSINVILGCFIVCTEVRQCRVTPIYRSQNVTLHQTV